MGTAGPIELVVFDMDGVLAHLDHARRLDGLSSFTGRSAEFLDRAIYRSDFEHSAEAGSWASGSEYLAELNRRIDSDLSREQWITVRRNAMTPIAETLRIARRLQGRVPIATLTNNGSLLKESIAEILPAAAEVFGASFHASFEFGARKPDPLVFDRLARRYRVAVERVLFIDDTVEYIEGAKGVGLETILFTDSDRLFAALVDFGLV